MKSTQHYEQAIISLRPPLDTKNGDSNIKELMQRVKAGETPDAREIALRADSVLLGDGNEYAFDTPIPGKQRVTRMRVRFLDRYDMKNFMLALGGIDSAALYAGPWIFNAVCAKTFRSGGQVGNIGTAFTVNKDAWVELGSYDIARGQRRQWQACKRTTGGPAFTCR